MCLDTREEPPRDELSARRRAKATPLPDGLLTEEEARQLVRQLFDELDLER